MIERMKAGTIIDGRMLDGRTYKREDGTYESYDLKDTPEGGSVRVMTDTGAYELVKESAEAGEAAVDGWKLGERAVQIALSEPTDSGSSFRHHGIVLREGLGMNVLYMDAPKVERNVVHSLGTIAAILAGDKAGSEPAFASARLDN